MFYKTAKFCPNFNFYLAKRTSNQNGDAPKTRAENLNLPRICISTPFIVSYWSDFNALVYLTKASSRLATDKIIIGGIPLGVKSLPLKIDGVPKKATIQIQISALIQTTYLLRFGHTERQVAETCCGDMSSSAGHTKRQS